MHMQHQQTYNVLVDPSTILQLLKHLLLLVVSWLHPGVGLFDSHAFVNCLYVTCVCLCIPVGRLGFLQLLQIALLLLVWLSWCSLVMWVRLLMRGVISVLMGVSMG